MFKGRQRLFLITLVFLAAAMIVTTTAYVQNEVGPVEHLEPETSITDGSDEPVNETPALWFVEMSSPPTSEGTSLATTRKEKADFRIQARRKGVQFEERMAFDKLWNGLSVKIDPMQLAALARTPGAKAIYPIETLTLPDPVDGSLAPELATALAQTGANIVQSTLGFTGAGVKVGIIDSGIDIDNPSLGGGGISGGTAFPSGRVVAGFDFVGDNFNSTGSAAQRVPVPDPNPDDCGGHGSHVAGIVGAHGHVTGVAPGVSFGAYRVFGCSGTTDGDIMIAAMERALDDGMDVVNVSIGAAFNWPTYPPAQAADRLVNKGVVVVCSAGNEGATGTFSGSAPGVGKKVIGVASFNNTHSNNPYFTITPDDRQNVYNPSQGGTAAIPFSGSFPMARTGTQASTADACTPLPAGSLTGKVALIRRSVGTPSPCGFYVKSVNAQNAGALGVVIYNNTTGGLAPLITPTNSGDPLVEIPVVGITMADGNLIDGRLASGPVTMTWTDQFVGTPISAATAGLISSFSSYGLSPDLTLKPDIGAPGGTIRSTVPIDQGSIAFNSGTSMASPHVAGAVALLLEARPHTNAQVVRSILQNSADPKLWSGNPGLGFIDIVHRQGAGMLDIDDAILATTKIEPGKLSLGESEFGPSVNSLSVKNEGASDLTYDLSHISAIQTLGTFALSFFNAPSTVVYSQLGVPVTSITVPAGGEAIVDVTISPHPLLSDRAQFGGYLVFTPQGGGQTYRVPFAGFKGDYQSIQVLVPTANNFPRMARLNPNGTFTFLPLGDGGTWTLTSVVQNTPVVAVHLDHQSRRIRMEIFDAVSGKSWHRMFEQEYVGRNPTATGFFALGWDGTTTNGKKENVVPNGQYVIRMTVEKALGDDGNPAHTETWTSPVITLARPTP